jgi:hypothetical protein
VLKRVLSRPHTCACTDELKCTNDLPAHTHAHTHTRIHTHTYARTHTQGENLAVRVLGYMLTENDCCIGRVVTDKIQTNEEAMRLVKVVDEVSEREREIVCVCVRA